MRIAQIILPGASVYEAKSQRADFASLTTKHDVTVTSSAAEADGADVAHIYGPSPLSDKSVAVLKVPFVASSHPVRRRFAWRRPPQPAFVVSPIARPDAQLLPEAVEEMWFASDVTPSNPRTEDQGPRTVASFKRTSTMNAIEQTLARIERFRDDVVWHLFDHGPAPSDLAGVDVWVDPAVDEEDFDGFVAEAIVAGKAVVASRTQMNSQRLEQGRCGFLVPCNDPNELSHAILAALFKPEVARSKIDAAKQTAGKFRPRQRSRVLERIYETLIR